MFYVARSKLLLASCSVLFCFAASRVKAGELAKGWPQTERRCDVESNIAALNTFMGSAEAKLDISACAHSKIAKFESFAYAASQLGSTKDAAIASLMRFANKVASKPTASAYCFKSAGVEPYEGSSWRDMTVIMKEIIPKLSEMDPKCLQMLQ